MKTRIEDLNRIPVENESLAAEKNLLIFILGNLLVQIKRKGNGKEIIN